MLALGAVTKSTHSSDPPSHHVIPPTARSAGSGWSSYLPFWPPSTSRTLRSLSVEENAGFRNPWPSWHKPTVAELWNSFQWGEDDDGCIDLAASHLADSSPPDEPDPSKRPTFSVDDWPNSPGAKAAQLLRIEAPDFSFPDQGRAKATWLGHAGVLVQLPSLGDSSSDDRGRPMRCLFDPIFSTRCSPSQTTGPIRSYPPPCKPEDLPEIDAVCISHNHFDHMDYESLMAVWRRSRDSVRFFVPLGNGRWLHEWGIPADRVVEMDWWDSVKLTHPSSKAGNSLKVWCTPAQHNSWRPGADADSALWSSWYLEYIPADGHPPYRVYFAGDTGYQFHPSPSWPPSPPSRGSNAKEVAEAAAGEDEYRENDTAFPPCPAFAEIRARIGPPNLLLLPISVGATFAYLRSFVPLPDWINPFPRHSPGVTAANHMPPWDAVRVMKAMTDGASPGSTGEDGQDEDLAGGTVAVAMHWGTFVPDPLEVLKTLGQLEWACRRQGVNFGRALPDPGIAAEQRGSSSGTGNTSRPSGPWFLALNHGQSVCV